MKVETSKLPETAISVEAVRCAGAFFDSADNCYLVDDEGGVQALESDEGYSLFRYAP